MASEAPNSYKDSYWSDLASQAESKTGIPAGLLVSIIQNGEKSNNNQVSSAGAKTPFQIIPSTRKALVDKYGVDPYLSPENAAEGAALLLKESLDRNKGDVHSAVAEYHGGTNRKNWGPINKAYVARVTGGHEDTKVNTAVKSFQEWKAAREADTGPTAQDQISQVQQIGQQISDRATPVTNEEDIQAQGEKVPESTESPNVDAAIADFQQWKASKPATPEKPDDLGVLGGIREAITGERRQTPETQKLPEWSGMPELNQMSVASAKTGVGTMFAAPDEIAQIIKANYPEAQLRQDAKGNYVIKSSVDGQEYVIPPGISWGDIPRIIGGLAAFTPAGRAASTLGMAGAKGLGALAATSGAGAAATQAAIEASQAATGGSFSPADVAATGAVGAALPVLGATVKPVMNAIANPLKSALGRTVGQEAAPIAENAAANSAKVTGNVAPMAAKPPTAPIEDTTLIPTVQKASAGSEKATQKLAQQVEASPETIKAAQRLGVEDYLQPDHLSTNQAYRNISQTIKTVPGSQARSAEIASLEEVSKKADDLISKIGGTKDYSTLNQNVKTALQKTQQELDAKANGLYDQLYDGIEPGTRVNANNILTFVKTQSRDLGGDANLSQLEKTVLKKLGTGKPPTYALLDAVRKDIGAAARMSGPFKDADTGLAKKMYSLISKDQENVAFDKGLGNVFKEAKAAVAMRKGVEDDLTALFGKNIDGSFVDAANKSIGALAKGNDTNLVKLIEHVPADMRKNVVASGIYTAMGKAAGEGRMNFTQYAKWYEGLLANKRSHTAIMTNLPPEARKQLSDMYRISKGISSASREYVPTGRTDQLRQGLTAQSKANKVMEFVLDKAGIPAAATIGSTAGPAGAALFVAAAQAAKGLIKKDVMQAADKLLLSPEFSAAVKASAGKPAAKKAAVKDLAKSKVFNDFKKAMGNPKEMSDREKFIMGILEAQQAQTTSK